jgi:hypothetical protein
MLYPPLPFPDDDVEEGLSNELVPSLK